MGFDINRFQKSDVKEEFICPICHDILEDPVLLEQCEHVFCSQCINEWLQKCEAKSCPIDRLAVNDKTLRPPQRSFKNLITSLLILCDFNENGCQLYVKIDDLHIHTVNCPFNPVVMNQEIECPAACGAIVKRCGSIDEHNCVVFLKNIIVENNNRIEELCNENNNLKIENNELNSDNIEIKDKYDEGIRHLEQLCQENRQLSVELMKNREKLSELNKLIDSKDSVINGLNKEIEKLRKINENLKQLSKCGENNDRISSNSDNNSLDLIDFRAEENFVNEFGSDETDSNETPIITSNENQKLVDTLCARNILSNKRVIRALLSIDRGVFAPSAASYALHHIRSVGYGAHTGPPSYDSAILQYLEPFLTNNCKVLDIGSGTGYLTACMATMVALKGVIIGIEHIPQLFQQSIETIEKYYPNLKQSGTLKLYLSDGRFGWTHDSPYDLIFIEPLTRRVPQKLMDQLKPGGRLVVPIGAREKDINLELYTKQMNGEVVRLVLCDDWKLMQENTPDLLDDKKLQLRTGWKTKLGF